MININGIEVTTDEHVRLGEAEPLTAAIRLAFSHCLSGQADMIRGIHIVGAQEAVANPSPRGKRVNVGVPIAAMNHDHQLTIYAGNLLACFGDTRGGIDPWALAKPLQAAIQMPFSAGCLDTSQTTLMLMTPLSYWSRKNCGKPRRSPLLPGNGAELIIL
jgi:hypothetical protein